MSFKNSDISAGIVTYNPDIEKLKKNIDSIIKQVDFLVIVDNRSKNIAELDRLISSYNKEKIFFKKNDANHGIAKALNIIASIVKEKGYRWVLTLDQDSECRENLIFNYLPYLSLEKIGQLSCLYEDRNFSNGNHLFKGVKDVEWCITSAALLNVDAWESVGGFDEELFIDSVDFDICLKMREKGFHIYKVGFVGFLHEIGNGKTRKIFSYTVKTWNHSPFRRYYSTRNALIVAKKHRLGTIKALLGIIKHMFLIFVFEDEKKAKFERALAGVIDGLKYGE